MPITETKVDETQETETSEVKNEAVNKTALKSFSEKETEKKVEPEEGAAKTEEEPKATEEKPSVEGDWIEQLTKLGELLTKEQKEEEQKETETEKKADEQAAKAAFDFAVSRETYNRAMESHEDFQGVMLEFGKKLADFLMTQTTDLIKGEVSSSREELLKTLPATVGNLTQRQVSLQQTVNDFWARNEALKPAKALVMKVASAVQAENPQAGPDEILKQTEDLLKTFTAKAKERKNGSGLPTDVKSPRSIQGAEEKSKTQKQLMTFLNRS